MLAEDDAPRSRSDAFLRELPWTQLGVVVVAFGVFFRVAYYLADRSLWLDESYLALNLMRRSYGGLSNTLDFNQGAPIGFLWGERLALDLLGDSQLALRFLPLLVGIAALVLFFLTARELLAPGAFLIALVLFATMEPFVRYAAEIKQYGLDVAVTVALLLLFTRTVEARGFSVRRTALVAAAGLAAVWLSHPSVFVLAGFGAGSTFAALRRGDRGSLAGQTIAYATWCASFLAVYLIEVRDLRALQQSVGGGGAGAGFGAKLKNIYTIFNDPGGFPRTAVGLAAFVALIGVVVLWRKRPAHVVFFAGATVALLAAGYLGKYPIGQRFLMFLLPLAVLTFAAGSHALITSTARPIALAAAVGLLALVFVPTIGAAAEHAFTPAESEEIEPLVTQIQREWRQGDKLYVYHYSQYALAYYLFCEDCNPSAPSQRRIWPVRLAPPAQPQASPALVSTSDAVVIGGPIKDFRPTFPELSSFGGANRVWVLVTHAYPLSKENLLLAFDGWGSRRSCQNGGLAFVCLYDFRSSG